MATITAGVRDALINIYIGMLQAAPGETALSAMVAHYENGMTQKQIAADLATSAGFQAAYPALQLASEFAAELVSWMAPEATAAGQAWATNWIIGRLNAGVSKSDIIVEASNALAVATNVVDFGAATQAHLNRLEVARHYAVTNEIAEDSADIISGVSSDAASVTAAIAVADGESTVGMTYALTTGLDSLEGNAGDDTFLALFNDAGGESTWSLGDVINGGGGNDTLIIASDSNSNLTLNGRNVSNVENLVINNAMDRNANLDINFAGKLFDNITVDLGFTDYNEDVTLDNLAATSAVTIQNVSGGDSDFDLNLNFVTSNATSASTTVIMTDLDVNELDTIIDATFTAATAYEFNLSVSDVDSNDNFNVNANITLEAADVDLVINVDIDNVVGEDINFYLDFNTDGVASTVATINISDSNVNEFDLDIDNNGNGTDDNDTLTLNLHNVNVDGNYNMDFDADHFETININVSGTVLAEDFRFQNNEGNDLTINIVANGDLTVDDNVNTNGNVGNTTINISGTGDVDLGDVYMLWDTDPLTTMTVDASDLSGNLTMVDANGNSVVAAIDSITGGSGNDHITLSGYSTVVKTGDGDDTVDLDGVDYGNAAAKTIDGGDGMDTIVINNGALLDAGMAAKISNFEILDFTNGTGTYDLSIEASLDDIRATGAIATAVTITKFASDNSLTLTNFNDADLITVTLATDGSADAMTVNVANTTTTTSSNSAVLDVSEIETLTIHSTTGKAASDNTVDVTANDMTKLMVTGNGDTTVVLSAAADLTQIDASGNSGGVTIDASTGGTVGGVSVKGTATVDDYTSTGNGDTIQLGGGADVITLTGGDNTIRYVARTDSTITLTDTSDPADGVADTAVGWDVITGFTVGNDIIELSSLLGLATGDARSAVLLKGNINDGNDAAYTAAEFEAAIGDGVDFFSTGLVDRAVAFAFNDNATATDQGFIFIDVNGDGNFTQADDMVIELVGVTAFTVTDIQFG